MESRLSNVIQHREAFGPDVQEQIAEVWTMVRRRPGLAIACLLVAFMVGTLYYLRAPRTYESKADLLLVTKRYSISGGEDGESPIYEKSMETHVEMICKPLIVGRAAKEYDLHALPSLAEEEDPVSAIIDSLTAQMKNENASIIEVAYRSPSPEDAKEVVDAITETYTKYLRDDNKETGQEIAGLIREANDHLLSKLQKNQEVHQSFQKDAPLMWREGRGINIHHERQGSIEVKRQELMTERTILTAKIEALNDAIESGSISREALYYEAMNSLQLDQEDSTWRAFQIAEREHFAQREAQRSLSSILVQEFVRLEVEESTKIDEFDEGHPDVASIRKRKRRIRDMLESSFKSQIRPSEILDETTEKLEDGTDYVAIYMQKLNDELTVIDRQISALDIAFLKEQKLANRMQEYLLRDQALKSEYDNTKQLFDVVVTRLQQVDMVNSYSGDTLTVVSPAKIGEQVAPRLLLVLLGSCLLGLTSACGLAWLRERSEDMFRSSQEIRQALGVPVVGRIPIMEPSDIVTNPSFPEFDSSVFTLHNESSPISEAFRGVRTSLFFSSAGQSHRVIQVTSPLPSDGKSTVSANLGVAIAKSGKKVLVIDADFRRPALTEMYGQQEKCKAGLAELIAGRATIEEAVLPTAVGNLFFLPVFHRPTQPSEMLSTPEFEALIDEFKKTFDVILIDTPPVLPVTDPCVVAARVDSVLITIRIRRGVQEAAKRAVEMLNDVGANIVGVIANGWTPQSSVERNSYGYGYGYTEYSSASWQGNHASESGNGKYSVEPTSVN